MNSPESHKSTLELVYNLSYLGMTLYGNVAKQYGVDVPTNPYEEEAREAAREMVSARSYMMKRNEDWPFPEEVPPKLANWSAWFWKKMVVEELNEEVTRFYSEEIDRMLDGRTLRAETVGKGWSGFSSVDVQEEVFSQNSRRELTGEFVKAEAALGRLVVRECVEQGRGGIWNVSLFGVVDPPERKVNLAIVD